MFERYLSDEITNSRGDARVLTLEQWQVLADNLKIFLGKMELEGDDILEVGKRLYLSSNLKKLIIVNEGFPNAQNQKVDNYVLATIYLALTRSYITSSLINFYKEIREAILIGLYAKKEVLRQEKGIFDFLGTIDLKDIEQLISLMEETEG